MLKFKWVTSLGHSGQIMEQNGFLWLQLHGRTVLGSAGKRRGPTTVNKMERLSEPSGPSKTLSNLSGADALRIGAECNCAAADS